MRSTVTVRVIRGMQTCSLRGGDQLVVYLCTWDSARWRRQVRHRRSWPAMLERNSRGRRSGIGRRVRKEKRLGRRRGGQALVDGRLSRIDWRYWLRLDGLCVLREKARGLRRGGWLYWRRWVRRNRGVLKRLKERHATSSMLVLVDLGVSWESHRGCSVSEKTVAW